MALTKIRLSHSTLELFNSCERKFQIDRLLTGEQVKYDSEHFSRGHAFGKGVQVYLLTGDIDKALFHAWLDYYPHIENPPKVTQHRTLHALLCAQQDLDALREKYEVVSFKGLPSVELGYKLNIDETFYYVGFIDLVLRNRSTGLYVILEIKYTGSWLEVDPMYMNSGQAVGYSIVIDKIVGEQQSDYGVLYFICQDKNKEPKEIQFHTKEYSKTLKDRLNWFITLGMDVDRIKLCRELNVFPMRASNCIAYNRTCKHFGTCQLSIGDKEKKDEEDIHEKAGKYTFTYELDEIIKDHLKRAMQ